MERLTELKYYITKLDAKIKNMHEYIEKMAFDDKTEVGVKFLASTVSYLKELREYKQLEEQGLLLRLPVKMGDTVYFLGRKCDRCEEDYCYRCPYNRNGEKRDDIFVYNMVVKQFRICNNSVYIVDTDAVWSSSEISLNIKQFGKTVFLTKEEAEQKLKEMESD